MTDDAGPAESCGASATSRSVTPLGAITPTGAGSPRDLAASKAGGQRSAIAGKIAAFASGVAPVRAALPRAGDEEEDSSPQQTVEELLHVLETMCRATHEADAEGSVRVPLHVLRSSLRHVSAARADAAAARTALADERAARATPVLPSAWVKREHKYKMDLEKYQHTIECQRGRIAKLEAEVVVLREGASIQSLEARILDLEAQLAQSTQEKTAVQSMFHELSIRHRQLIETSPAIATLWTEVLVHAGAGQDAAAMARLQNFDLRHTSAAAPSPRGTAGGGGAAGVVEEESLQSVDGAVALYSQQGGGAPRSGAPSPLQPGAAARQAALEVHASAAWPPPLRSQGGGGALVTGPSTPEASVGVASAGGGGGGAPAQAAASGGGGAWHGDDSVAGGGGTGVPPLAVSAEERAAALMRSVELEGLSPEASIAALQQLNYDLTMQLGLYQQMVTRLKDAMEAADLDKAELEGDKAVLEGQLAALRGAGGGAASLDRVPSSNNNPGASRRWGLFGGWQRRSHADEDGGGGGAPGGGGSGAPGLEHIASVSTLYTESVASSSRRGSEDSGDGPSGGGAGGNGGSAAVPAAANHGEAAETGSGGGAPAGSGGAAAGDSASAAAAAAAAGSGTAAVDNGAHMAGAPQNGDGAPAGGALAAFDSVASATTAASSPVASAASAVAAAAAASVSALAPPRWARRAPSSGPSPAEKAKTLARDLKEAKRQLSAFADENRFLVGDLVALKMQLAELEGTNLQYKRALVRSVDRHTCLETKVEELQHMLDLITSLPAAAAALAEVQLPPGRLGSGETASRSGGMTPVDDALLAAVLEAEGGGPQVLRRAPEPQAGDGAGSQQPSYVEHPGPGVHDAGGQAGHANAVVREPVAGEPVTGEPVAGEPVTGEPVAGEPVTGEPVAGEPVAGEPVAGEPVAGEAGAGEAGAGEAMVSEEGRPQEGGHVERQLREDGVGAQAVQQQQAPEQRQQADPSEDVGASVTAGSESAPAPAGEAGGGGSGGGKAPPAGLDAQQAPINGAGAGPEAA